MFPRASNLDYLGQFFGGVAPNRRGQPTASYDKCFNPLIGNNLSEDGSKESDDKETSERSKSNKDSDIDDVIISNED